MFLPVSPGPAASKVWRGLAACQGGLAVGVSALLGFRFLALLLGGFGGGIEIGLHLIDGFLALLELLGLDLGVGGGGHADIGNATGGEQEQ
jgi:hypothetical protein